MPLYVEDLYDKEDLGSLSDDNLFAGQDDRSQFTKGFSAGIDQTQALGGGLLALVGSAVNNDDLMFSGLDYYNEQMAEAAESQGDIGRIEDIDGFDDFLSWVSYTAGNSIPSLATAVAGGGIGGVVAKSVAKSAIQKKALTYAKDRLTDKAASSFKKRVADDYTAAALSKAARVGGGVGAYLTSTGMGGGEAFTRILNEEGEEAPGVALITGMASGALDAIAPMRALKRIFPGREYESVIGQMANGVSNKSSFYTRALKESGKQAGIEGLTEGMQEIVQNVALEYVQTNYTDLGEAFTQALVDESKYSAYVNAAAAGVVGGGVFGGVSGAVTNDPVTQTSRVLTDEIETANFDAEVAGAVDRAKAEPLPESEYDQDGNLLPVEDDQSLEDGRKEKQSEAQRKIDAQNRYGPLFDQIEARKKAQKVIADLEQEEAAVQPPQGDAEADQNLSAMDEAVSAAMDPEDSRLNQGLENLVGNNVSFRGVVGVLVKREDGYFVVADNEDIFIESGESRTARDLGVELTATSRINTPTGTRVTSGDLEFDADVTYNPRTSELSIRGKKYTYLRTNSDDDGNTVSIQVIDDEGNSRTIREASVVSRVERMKIEAEGGVLPAGGAIDPNPVTSDQEATPTTPTTPTTPAAPTTPTTPTTPAAPTTPTTPATPHKDTMSFDDLPVTVQEDIVADAETENVPIPDEITIESALDKAKKLTGYEREVALAAIDEAILKAIDLRKGATEIQKPTAEPGRYRKYVNPSINRARDREDSYQEDVRNYVSPKDAVSAAVQDNNAVTETVYDGTEDSFTKDQISEEELSLPTRRIRTGPYITNNIQPDETAGKILALAVVDLISMGLPKSWLKAVDGGFSVYVPMSGRGAAFFAPADNFDRSSEGFIGVASKYLSSSNALSGQFRFVLAHEIAHAADHKFEITARMPGFNLELIADDGTGDLTFSAGEVISELYDLYTSGTEFGMEFAYPFAHVSPDHLRKYKDDVESVTEFLRAEAFAQAFATFISSPALLKKEAPVTYGVIKTMLQDPQLSAFNALNTETQNENTVQQDLSQGDTGAVLQEIRSPTQPRGDEGRGSSGGRASGISSPEEGQAGEVVGGAQSLTDRDENGPSLREEADRRDVDLTEPQTLSSNLMQIVDLSDLRPESQSVTASQILYGDEEKLDVGDRPTVVSVATALDRRVAEAYPDRNLLAQNPENAEIISDMIAHEALAALDEEGNAGEWYQEKVSNAMSLAAQKFPELASDVNAKFAFTSIMAITSNGASVPENSVNTFKLYEEYRETKKFSLFGVGKESKAMKSSFALLNELINEHGIDSVLKFMDKDVTVKELKDNFNLGVSGELMGTQLKGSAILGPKIGGGFYQNLNGNFNPLTMDRWFMRTYGRLTGSLMSEATRKLPAQIDKFRGVALSDEYKKKLKDDGISRVQLRKDDDYLLSYATRVQSAYAKNGFKEKNEINKASNTLKNSQGEKQAPQNGTEREYIRQVMQLALDKVNKYNGNRPVNMGALQAIIWYPEKELYKLHGVGNAKSEPTDYETEFRKILEGEEPRQELSGPIRLARESGPDIIQRTVGEDDSNQNQVDGAEVQEPVQVDQPQLIQEAESQPTQQPDPEGVSLTEDLNAQIREENKPIFERVKKTFRRYLAPEGLLPKSIFDEKIKRDSELGAVEIDIRQLVAQYDDAVKTVYNRDLSDAEQKSLQEALTTEFSNIDSLGLDPEIKNAIIGMRRYLDNMSIDYAQILLSEAQALSTQGRDDKASAKIDLLNTIASNVGSYANRSYRAFDDPKWANNVPDNVLDDARAYLQERGVTNVENVLNNILKEGTAFDSMEAFVRESKLGAKDLTILKQRKDIAPQIRALLGEYIDPRVNFGKSATKMSRLLFNDRFLKQVKDIGMDTFFFDPETAPPEAYVTFAAESSDVMAPLNGLKTTPEIAQAFQDALGKEQMEDWYRYIVQANGMVKYGKTVIAPTTLARNYLSAYMFTLANGHFNAGKLGESFESMGAYFKGTGNKIEYLRRLKELGVVYDTPYAGEMLALLDDAKQDFFGNDKNKFYRFSKTIAGNATKLYQFGDDMWKIVGFENEIDILMNAKGITRAEAEPIAAKRIRDTYPTYSLVGRGVQKLRRFPLAGTFVSFPAEVIRTSFNMIKYLREDMKDPDMRGTVPRRVAGLGMVSAGVYALQEALINMIDVDEEEEEAVRILGPAWSQNSNLGFIGREKGRLQYVDMSAFDPYNYFKRPINALLRDQPIDDAMMQSAAEAMKPFFGADISFSNLMEIYKNEKASGGSVYNETDTTAEQLSSISYHLIKGVGPSVISNVERMVKAIDGDRNASGRVYKFEDEMAALAGFRVSTFDPKISLHFRAFDFNQNKRDSTRILTSTFRDVNDVSDRELRDAFQRSASARKEAFDEMSKIVSAARSSGLNQLQIIKVLRSNGITKKDALALESGDPAKWEMSDSILKNSVTKADLLFGDSTGQEYERRWKIIQALLNDEDDGQ